MPVMLSSFRVFLLLGSSLIVAETTDRAATDEFRRSTRITASGYCTVDWPVGKEYSLTCESGDRNVTWRYPPSAEPEEKYPENTFNISSSHLIFPDGRTNYTYTGYYCCVGTSESNCREKTPEKCNRWRYLFFNDDEHVFQDTGSSNTVFAIENTPALLPCSVTNSKLHVDLNKVEGLKNETVPIGREDVQDGSLWSFSHKAGFRLSSSKIKHSGNYSCIIKHKGKSFEKSFYLDVIKCYDRDDMQLEMYTTKDVIVDGDDINLTCRLAVKNDTNIELRWKHNDTIECNNSISEKLGTLEDCPVIDLYLYTLTLKNVSINDSGSYTCVAYKSPQRFDFKNMAIDIYRKHYIKINIKNNSTQTQVIKLNENYTVNWKVSVLSESRINSIEWIGPSGVMNNNTKYTINIVNTTEDGCHVQTELSINKLGFKDSGLYKMKACNLKMCENKRMALLVKSKPVVTSLQKKSKINRYAEGHYETISCMAFGYPRPEIYWVFQCEGCAEENITRSITTEPMNETVTHSVLKYMVQHTADIFCVAVNSEDKVNASLSIPIDPISYPEDKYLAYMVVSCVASFIVIVSCVIWCFVKRRRKKMKKSKEEFQNIVRISSLLNPGLTVDRQLDVLPYDKRWEYPAGDLKLGMILGSGQFGLVRKAEARFILPGEAVSTVAVKIAKSYEAASLEALKSELKILSNLGQHLNIVNLLGACTQRIGYGELMVMLEFCRYGNIHDYLQYHRGNFVSQLNPSTGGINNTAPLRKKSRVHYAKLLFRISSEENECSNHCIADSAAQSEELSWLHTMTLNKRKCSNHKTPFCTQDLLCWSFQVARGMEYLASRKVFHGDLAARNTLLADNNVVKICDFGLSKKLYNLKHYKGKGDGVRPLKWMAIESIKDQIFSTESDVWAYGVLLWEYFSLGYSPYPGMDADIHLFRKLLTGYRMEKPKYCPLKIYQMMQECWLENPYHRPTFEDLTDKLGAMLSEKVRMHYVELNHPYAELNLGATQQDVLSMVSAPTYGNMVSSRNSSFIKRKSVDRSKESVASITSDMETTNTYLTMEKASVESFLDESGLFEDAVDCSSLSRSSTVLL